MAVFRLLMRRYPDELPAGEIAQALSLKASTASVYLSALTHAGLIAQRRDGTRLLYAVNLDAAGAVVSGLFVDCCRMRTASFWPNPNFAETILRDRAGDRFTAYSAGTQHRSELNPFAVEMLRSKGHDVSHLRSKNLSEFQGNDAPRMDFVFTVCNRAANEECPTWPGQPISGHWGMPDPVKAQGTDAEKRLAFQQTYGGLYNRINAFTSLSFEMLDRGTLQKHVDEIGLERATQD